MHRHHEVVVDFLHRRGVGRAPIAAPGGQVGQSHVGVDALGDAHARGILARFWGAPAWPVSARDNIWRTLLENGVDWVNADDLEAAANL